MDRCETVHDGAEIGIEVIFSNAERLPVTSVPLVKASRFWSGWLGSAGRGRQDTPRCGNQRRSH
jgi:hypothetical protein